MELLYTPQNLIAWQLNNSYNKIYNTEIVKPSWKWNKTYWDTFFIKKRPSVNTSTKNVPTWDIVDNMTIDWVEYLLIHNWTDIEVAYDDGVNYTWFWLSYTAWDNTPIRFVKWKSGRGDITDWVTIWDPYFDLHDTWTWLIWSSYSIDQIVQYSWDDYIAIAESTWEQPDTSTDYWIEYVTDLSWYEVADPATIEYRDVYKWSYLKIKLEKTAIRDAAIVGSYILFTNNDSNLQGITTEIHYVETTYIDTIGTIINLPLDEVYVYIRWTNLSGSIPYVTETVAITSKVWNIPIIATDTKIVSLHTIEELWVITWAKAVEIYEAADWDEIVDLVKYNWVQFILTLEKVLFSRTLLTSNINIYPLDVFLNLWLIDRIIPFWKTLVMFWENNAVIIPVVWTAWTDWYVLSDLHYNSTLYSKYSVISSMGSLYVLQSDKQFVQIDISSENNVDYNVTATNAIQTVRGLFETIVWDIFITEWNKQVYVLDIWAHWTYYYKYDIEYKHWDTWDYLTSFYKIENKLYWDWLFEFNDEYFDNVSDYRDQIVWFDFWGEDLTTLKEVVIVKLIFWLNEKLVDYNLVVQYQLGWILHSKTIDLTNYPINLEIWSWDAWLWDSLISTTLIWAWKAIDTVAIWNFISVTVWLWITASVFNFEIQSKDNWFVYWGSIIGYINKLPTVTEYNYKH